MLTKNLFIITESHFKPILLIQTSLKLLSSSNVKKKFIQRCERLVVYRLWQKEEFLIKKKILFVHFSYFHSKAQSKRILGIFSFHSQSSLIDHRKRIHLGQTLIIINYP